jgi:hypothetical protein
MVEFKNARDVGDSLLEVRDFLVVISQFDERGHGGESAGVEDEISM